MTKVEDHRVYTERNSNTGGNSKLEINLYVQKFIKKAWGIVSTENAHMFAGLEIRRGKKLFCLF